MKVHKSTWLDIKSGSPWDICEAINNSMVPERAVATDVRFNFEVDVNMLLDTSSNTFAKQMRFEWTDDE